MKELIKLRLKIFVILLVVSKLISATNITLNGKSISITDKASDVYFQLDDNWRFSIGDNPEWAKPDFEFSKWDTLYLPLCIKSLQPFGYKGNVWFRTTFLVKQDMVSKPISLLIQQFGASEIYIDGKLIHQLGKIGNSTSSEEAFNPHNIPISFAVDSVGLHTIAVRYSNHNKMNDVETELDAFDLNMIKAEVTETISTATNISKLSNCIGIGIFLTLSIINFILFLFYKRDIANLYYSLFSIAMTITFTLNVVNYSCNSTYSAFLIQEIKSIFLFISNFFLVALVHSFIYNHTSKRLKVILAITIIGIVLVFINSQLAEILSNMFNVYCVVDIIITVVKAIAKKYNLTKKHRNIFWLIIVSVIIIGCLGYFIDHSIPFIVLGLLLLVFVIPIAGMIFIIPLYMTIRHARSFAVTNASLEEQLIQVKELSAKTIEKKKMLETENERLEQMVNIRTAELAQKNNEIKDSINYAQRIQNAMLTDKAEINQTLKNCFILFKPKDIVSGDFYFYTKKENTVFIAAADCTGHGVPGALMSMIGAEKLMGIVNEYSNPSDILFYLNQGIKSSLKQTEQGTSTKDGMDIALTAIDLNTFNVNYSGANRPIWIIKNGSTEIEEIKATKKAIGGYTEGNQKFEQHNLQLQKGDTYYLFTDGFADQFGSNGKKLMTKRFKEILLEIQHLSMQEQESYLNNFIENWKNGVEQIDDILVIGIRY